MENINELNEARKRFVDVIKSIQVKINENVELKIEEKSDISGIEIGSIIYGNVSNAISFYNADKFSTPRGHGFAAEHANHLYDKIAQGDFFGHGKVVLEADKIDPKTGRIVKNGADRVVNGVHIQTKYCNSGGKCISECFNEKGFRYFNSDGSPMQIEVPSDKYDAAVQAMEKRIRNGEVKGVTDPAEAKKIVRKGHFTYEQAKNIAKAGTIESIVYDSVNGVIIATSAFGISAVMTFATSVWNGENIEAALKNATHSGLKVGGTTFVTAVLSSQLSKAGLNSLLVRPTEALVKRLRPETVKRLTKAFSSGKNIYGAAAMKNTAKMLRGNIITSVVSVAVLSSVDVVNIFRGRISGKQLFKNVAGTTVSVAGGTAGWIGGAAAGATIGSVVPLVGTTIGGVVGGFIGSIAGGAASSKVANAALNVFIEDDADEMVRIIEMEFTQLVQDYLLSKKEVENILDVFGKEMNGNVIKDMFASGDRNKYARNLLVKHIDNEVIKRKKIIIPSEEKFTNALIEVLEEISDDLDEVDEINEKKKLSIADFEISEANFYTDNADSPVSWYEYVKGDDFITPRHITFGASVEAVISAYGFAELEEITYIYREPVYALLVNSSGKECNDAKYYSYIRRKIVYELDGRSIIFYFDEDDKLVVIGYLYVNDKNAKLYLQGQCCKVQNNVVDSIIHYVNLLNEEWQFDVIDYEGNSSKLGNALINEMMDILVYNIKREKEVTDDALYLVRRLYNDTSITKMDIMKMRARSEDIYFEIPNILKSVVDYENSGTLISERISYSFIMVDFYARYLQLCIYTIKDETLINEMIQFIQRLNDYI